VSLTLPMTATGFTFAPHMRRDDRRIARPASLLNPSFNCEDTFHADRRAFINLDSLPWSSLGPLCHALTTISEKPTIQLSAQARRVQSDLRVAFLLDAISPTESVWSGR
jgi:hypothetical protein